MANLDRYRTRPFGPAIVLMSCSGYLLRSSYKRPESDIRAIFLDDDVDINQAWTRGGALYGRAGREIYRSEINQPDEGLNAWMAVAAAAQFVLA